MPKLVDHEERRRQIAEALLRVAAVRGLHQAGLREVAAEAGMSVRLIQYYFGTKEQLLLYATQYLAVALSRPGQGADRSRRRGRTRARAIIEAILAEALPDDEDSREFNVIWTSYLALSLTDPGLDHGPAGSGLERDHRRHRGPAARGPEGGPMRRPGWTPSWKRPAWWPCRPGWHQRAGPRPRRGQAWAVIRYQLDRLLPSP